MKKTLFILIISIFYCSYNASAQGAAPDPCDTWTWHNNYIQKLILDGFNFAGQNKVQGITKNEYDNWVKSCKKVKENYENMENNNQKSYSTDNDITQWENLNNKIYNSIKTEKWKGIGITKKQVDPWKKSCDDFKKKYNTLKHKSKTNNSDNLRQDDTKLLTSANTSQTIIIQQPENYKNLIDASNKAFELCIFLPLSVEYDEKSVEKSYNIALELIKTNEMTDKNKQTWKNYNLLLRDYGIYNNDVIEYIKKIEENIKLKQKIEINEYKKSIGISMPKYSKYYNNAVSIKHLDDILNEFFNLLEDYNRKKDIPSDKFFRNFIINNLDSNYK